MPTDPAFIVHVLRDLQSFAAKNCRSEVANHLEGARRHVELYLSDDPKPPVPDTRAQTAQDVLENLVEFARKHRLDDMLIHLLAARRKLLLYEPVDTANGEVVTFPVPINDVDRTSEI